MKNIIWIGVCIAALINIVGCSSRPDDDTMRWAIAQRIPACGLEGYCEVSDYKVTNTWSKIADDNEEHLFFDFTATFVRKPNRNGTVYEALPVKWERSGTIEMAQRGNKWVAF